MHRIDWTIRALNDLDRLEDFLFAKNAPAAARAIAAIIEAVDQLADFPESGRTADGFRELLVKFSNAGYVVRYQFADGTVLIVGIRHQREAGY
jgi:plasmid stabilization system protein ParE